MDNKERLIHILEQWVRDDGYDTKDGAFSFDRAADRIIAANLLAPQWVSVKERLPEKESSYASVDCLFYTGSYVRSGYYKYGAGQWHEPSTGDWFDSVTHWQPIPTPPEDQS